MLWQRQLPCLFATSYHMKSALELYRSLEAKLPTSVWWTCLKREIMVFLEVVFVKDNPIGVGFHYSLLFLEITCVWTCFGLNFCFKTQTLDYISPKHFLHPSSIDFENAHIRVLRPFSVLLLLLTVGAAWRSSISDGDDRSMMYGGCCSE